MEFDVTEWNNNMARVDRKTRVNKDKSSSRIPDSKLPNYFSFGSGVARTFRGGGKKVVSDHQSNSNRNRNKDISMKDVEEALNIK